MSLLHADLFKMRKRALGWVLLAICAVVVALATGIIAFVAQSQPDQPYGVWPQGLSAGPLIVAQSVGTLLMVVFGAVLVGSEYGYDTWKVLLTRHASRGAFIWSKWLTMLIMLGVALVLLALWSLALTAGYGVLFNLDRPATVSFASVLAQTGAALLALAVPGSIGLLGATVGRSTVAGIVAGIVWSVGDSIVPLINQIPAWLRGLSFAAASSNLQQIVASNLGTWSDTGNPGTWSAAYSLLVLGAYLVVPVVVAALVFRQRDMVS